MFLISLIPAGPANSEPAEGVDFGVTGNVSETYDDNITFSKDDPEQDFITNIEPGFKAEYEDEFKSWLFKASLNQPIFAKNERFNKPEQMLAFDFQKELSRYSSVSLGEEFSHTYEPVTFADAFGRTTGRYGYYHNNLTLEYLREIARQVIFKGGYKNELDVFSREDLSDSYLNKIGFSMDYSLNSTTLLLCAYDFSNRKFHPGDSAQENSLSAGIRKYLTKQLSLEARSGVDFINSFNATNYIKPMVFLSLMDEISEGSSFGISLLKDYRTNAYNQDVFNEWEVGAFFNRELFRNLSCHISAFYGEGKYPVLGIKDRIAGEELSFVYTMRENLNLDLSYAHSRVNSSDQTREYGKNKVTVGLRMDF